MEPSSTTNDSNEASESMVIISTGAKNSSDSSHKEAILICGICKKLVDTKKTKLLPCLHSLCSNCEFTAMTDGKITCNCCNQSCCSNEIVDHFLVQHLSEDSKSTKCSNCTDNAITKFKCLECEDFLCLECSQAHKRVKITKDHQLVEVEVADISTEIKCSSHKSEELTWFCLTCDKVTCRNCQLENHSGHQYRPFEVVMSLEIQFSLLFLRYYPVEKLKFLQEQVKLYQSQMEKLAEDNRNKMPYIEQVITLANQRAQEVTNSENAMKMELIKGLNLVKQALENRGKFLLFEIEKISQDKRRNYIEIKSTAEKIESMSKQIVAFAETSLESNNKFAIYNTIKVLRNSLKIIERLKEHRPTVNVSQMVQLSLHFPASEFVSLIGQLGDLIVDRYSQLPINYVPNPHPHPTGMMNMPCNEFCYRGIPLQQIRAGTRLSSQVGHYESSGYSNHNFRSMVPPVRCDPQSNWSLPPACNFQYNQQPNACRSAFEINKVLSPQGLNTVRTLLQQPQSGSPIHGINVPQTNQPFTEPICPRPPPLKYGPQPRFVTHVENILDPNRSRKRHLGTPEEIILDQPQTLPDIEANSSYSLKVHAKQKITNDVVHEQALPVVQLSPNPHGFGFANDSKYINISQREHIFSQEMVQRKDVDTTDKKPIDVSDQTIPIKDSLGSHDKAEVDEKLSLNLSRTSRFAKKSIVRVLEGRPNLSMLKFLKDEHDKFI